MSSLVKSLTDDTYERETNTGDPVLVCFYAKWLPDVINLALESVAKAYEGRVTVAKLDYDCYEEFSRQFEVYSIPTYLLYHGGTVEYLSCGPMDESDLSQWLNRFI